MKRIYGFAVLLLIVCNSFAQQADKYDELLIAYAKQMRFNGAALVSRGGNVLLNKGYGYRNAANKILNTAESIFQLGSITKQFTSAVILKLQAEKKLNVKDKLSKYFPAYDKADSITIEQLLTHTSGIYNYTNNETFMANEITKPASREKIFALFKNKPLDFTPGTKWNYSNSGYMLLGYIIEDVTHMSYEKAVRRYIFSQVKMIHSGFDFTHLSSPDKTTGYGKMTEKDPPVTPIVDSTVAFAAGAIYSTTGDLLLWHKALENNTVLSAAQQQQAYTPVMNEYGYGWGIDSIEGKQRVGHGGGIPGYITKFSRVPEDDICIVLLSNASDQTLDEITKSLYAILYNKPYTLPVERKQIKLPEATLKQYEGEYEIRPDLHVVISVKNGELVALPTGQNPNVLYAEKEDSFFVKEQDIQVTFTRNADNKVDGFVLHQNGATVPCKKIK